MQVLTISPVSVAQKNLPGWDASPLQGYPHPPAFDLQVPTDTPGWREALKE